MEDICGHLFRIKPEEPKTWVPMFDRSPVKAVITQTSGKVRILFSNSIDSFTSFVSDNMHRTTEKFFQWFDQENETKFGLGFSEKEIGDKFYALVQRPPQSPTTREFIQHSKPSFKFVKNSPVNSASEDLNNWTNESAKLTEELEKLKMKERLVLTSEIQTLNSEISQYKRTMEIENEKHMKDIVSLTKQIEDVIAQNEELNNENKRLRMENREVSEQLRKTLAMLKKFHNSTMRLNQEASILNDEYQRHGFPRDD